MVVIVLSHTTLKLSRLLMRYFLDTEFNGFGGTLISLALVSEEGETIYLSLSDNEIEGLDIEPWVRKNVLPVLSAPGAQPERLPRKDWARRLASYFKSASSIDIVADWPDDIRYLMQAITVRPGEMIPLPDFTISCRHVPSWPTRLKGAVRHNALWDARALREVVLRPFTDSLKQASG